MKNIKYIFIILGVLVCFSSCAELLDTEPGGSKVTSEQKAAIIADSPELLSADIAGLAAALITFDQSGNEGHWEFGFASACIMMDSNGSDMPCIVNFNHFGGNASYSDRLYEGSRPAWMWNLYYAHMKVANDILKLVPQESVSGDNPDLTLKSYRGMALASRAWDYLNLAQIYQFTYLGNESKLCVPIITEKTTPAEAANNPRATVEAVYKLIMDDLNEAITLLDGYARPDKGTIDAKVAYALRARANLLMGKGKEAAADAVIARSSAPLLSKADISKPGFNSVDASSTIWGSVITETNRVVTTGICNWPSMLCSFQSNSYVQLGLSFRRISVLLYDKISSTDTRKGWWLDSELKTPLIDVSKLSDGQKVVVGKLTEHANVKFGAYQDIIGNGTNASDWIMIRSEEMLLIEAEGLAMNGQIGAAKTLLENWVQGSRDASYVCTASTVEALRDEIWFQRRVELWGEGFSFHDNMRLSKPITRVAIVAGKKKTNYPDVFQFNIKADNDVLLWRIPRGECDANGRISNDDSPKTPAPLPGDGV